MDEKIGVEITATKKTAVVAFKTTSISSAEGIEAVSRQINEFIEENHPKRVIIDFERVKFFSSQMLGALLRIRAKLETYDGEVVISAINPQLHRIFKITNLDKIFRFFPDKESAASRVNTS